MNQTQIRVAEFQLNFVNTITCPETDGFPTDVGPDLVTIRKMGTRTIRYGVVIGWHPIAGYDIEEGICVCVDVAFLHYNKTKTKVKKHLPKIMRFFKLNNVWVADPDD